MVAGLPAKLAPILRGPSRSGIVRRRSGNKLHSRRRSRESERPVRSSCSSCKKWHRSKIKFQCTRQRFPFDVDLFNSSDVVLKIYISFITKSTEVDVYSVHVVVFLIVSRNKNRSHISPPELSEAHLAIFPEIRTSPMASGVPMFVS